VSILWDLLAQLCNVIFHTGVEINKIYYYRYFNKQVKNNSFELAKEIKEYLDEKEDINSHANPWPGNHMFLNDYRNRMTHQVAPSITSISSLGHSLKPPAMYVLHRVTEDYYKVFSFLCKLINDFLKEYEGWLPTNNLNINSDEKE
jgi:hypothetical protein